jgi:hypothetical protein
VRSIRVLGACQWETSKSASSDKSRYDPWYRSLTHHRVEHNLLSFLLYSTWEPALSGQRKSPSAYIATMSFLSLPPELRCLVYAHTTSSHETFREYHGLYLSCKLINQEMDHEQNQVILSHIKDMQSTYPAESSYVELSLAPSTTNAISRNLQVSLPVSKCYYTGCYYTHLPFHNELLHFTTLTVDCHNKAGERLQGVNASNVQKLLEHLLMYYRDAWGVERIAVRLVSADQRNILDWMNLVHGALAHHHDKASVWRRYRRAVVKDGGLEVIWERKRRKEELQVASTRSILPVSIVTCLVAGLLLHIAGY